MKMMQLTYRLTKIIGGTIIILLLNLTGLCTDTLRLNNDLDILPLTGFITVFETPDELTAGTILTLTTTTKLFQPVKSTSFGFSKSFYWFRMVVKNESTAPLNLVILADNPHIDSIQAWEFTGFSPLKSIYIGGDAIPFYDRTVINRNYTISLELAPNEAKTIFIMADKRNASVSVPLYITKQSHFDKKEKSVLFIYGIYFGVILLIIVFSLFFFSIIRQEIFFWYAFYIFFLGLYLAAHIGILFQIGYPNMNAFNDYSRPLFISLCTTGLIQFIRLLLNVKQLLPKLNPVYNWLIITQLAATFWWVSTPWWHDAQTIIYLNIQNFTLLGTLILVLTSSILTFKHQPVIVGFFWVAFMAVLTAGLFLILIETGVINENAVSVNPLFIGSLIEVIVFAMGLSYWSKVNEKERIQLVYLVQESKKQMVDSYINGIESEKQKISSDLHDDIGSRLSHLKRKTEMESEDRPDIVKKFKQVTAKVRFLSHELAPPSFAKNEFLISVKYLISSHESTELALTLQIFDLPDSLETITTKHLYRILQNTLSNIEKHAKATTVDIQFFYYNNELVLTIEDNGKGFTYVKGNPSMGIKEIESRVESLGGTIDISSSKKRGTSIMITVPV